MTKYCTECGDPQTTGSFCGGCGTPVSGSAPTVAQPSLSPTAPVAPRTAAATRRTRRRHGVAAAAALTLSIGALSAFAINSQAGAGADEQAAAEQAQLDAEAQAKAKAKAEKKRIAQKAERIAARQAAEERKRMQAQPAPAAPAAPATATASSVGGGWEGSMDSGQYSFSMDLSESGGSVSGSMYQYDSSDGEDGTESLTGYREGNTVYLQGTSWSGAPSSWSLDSIVVTLSGDGSSMSGSFTCATCSGSKDISGYRIY